ncbi:MAG: hypothetical protein QOJ22_1005, partial [Thermoleophilaceae bacterium]|nr:hypothetical protein [Thermoleophilaceae bacterium]
MARFMVSRLRILLVAVALPLLAWAVLPMISDGATLQGKIESKQQQIDAHRSRERALTTDIAGYTRRINTLQADITTLTSRQVRLQADLDAKLAELARIQDDLRRERLRLSRLRARLAEARVALSNRLVQLYKADRPDIVTVVLSANGFEDLLERTEFMTRVSDQDGRIIARVRAARVEAIATAKRLDALEERSRKVAESIEIQRDQVVQVKGQLVDRQDRWRDVRGQKSTVLASTQASRHELEDHLESLQKEQAQVAARLAGSSSPVAGPVRQ